MKILHINGTSKGGAANFAINLHQCLVKKELNLLFVCQNIHL